MSNWGLACDPRGRLWAGGSHDGSVRLWDLATGACLRAWHAHDDLITALAYSPQTPDAGRTPGVLLASAGYDGAVRLWDADTGALLRTLLGETRVPAIAFSPNGRLLAGGSHSELVRIWDLAHRRSCLPAVAARLAAGERRVQSFFPDVRVRAVPAAELARYDPAGGSPFST